jgi:hypothetical protein
MRCVSGYYLAITFSHTLTPVAINRRERRGVPIPMASIRGKILEDGYTRVL